MADTAASSANPPLLTSPLHRGAALLCWAAYVNHKNMEAKKGPKGFVMEPDSGNRATEVEKTVNICLFQAVVITKCKILNHR